MDALTTIIAAASLLLHTMLGCCTHGDRVSCACLHRALGTEHHAHDGDDASACPHHGATDLHHSGHRSVDAEHDVDPTPLHPCRCHCEGDHCQAVAGSPARTIEAPDVSFDVLPPLQVNAAAGGLPLDQSRLVDLAAATPALPLRAHLFFQSLLI